MSLSRRKFLLGSSVGAVSLPGIAGLMSGPKGVEKDAVRRSSLWANEISPLPPQPRFEGERKVDLAIVGGGYTGLSCAYYVKQLRPDWSVVVLDSHAIGSGASSRNSGAVSPKYVGLDDTAMPARGLDRLRDFIEIENIDCNFDPSTNLRVFDSKDSAASALSANDPRARWVSAQELKEASGTEFYKGGAIEYSGLYKVHPAKLVFGHANAALRVGAELFEKSPVLHIQPGKTVQLSTPKGRIIANNVFVATNAYTPRLGLFEYKMFPVHQYSVATRKLNEGEIQHLGLDRWGLRFEQNILPATFGLTPSGHFFIRMVLGYASHDSCEWRDMDGARQLARKIFEQRYPRVADIGLEHDWHGVTGHTVLGRQIAGPIADGNIHVSVAYNGSGIMPAHNNGYLTACNIVGKADQDLHFLTGVSGQLPYPGDFYRSLMLKPFMKMMTPV